jgi:hypothetical protein
MCKSIKILAKVKSGDLSYCASCKVFHLIFNNLFFELSHQDFGKLKSYINHIEVGYWEHKHACPKIKRKIPLPSSQENLVMVFNRQEITELGKLLNYQQYSSTDKLLNIDDIDYNLKLN